MKRFTVWTISAALAIAFYAVANVAGLSETLRLVVTFAGALVGAAIGNVIMQKRQQRNQ